LTNCKKLSKLLQTIEKGVVMKQLFEMIRIQTKLLGFWWGIKSAFQIRMLCAKTKPTKEVVKELERRNNERKFNKI